MSRVFSYEEIRDGRVPGSNVFDIALANFEEFSQNAVDNGIIDGSFVYGSVALGVANRRSDFDNFISLTDGCVHSYNTVKNFFASVVELNPSIPTTPMVYAKQALRQGRHEIDRFFGQHLACDHRVVIGNDPATYIKYSDQPAGDILTNYLAQKKRRLTNTYVSPEPLDLRDGCGLQRMLELPAAVGRKVVQALVEVGDTDEPLGNSADKLAVIQKARKVMGQELVVPRFKELIISMFDELVRSNADYDELLDAALNDDVSKTEYESEIIGLFNNLPMAIEWLNYVELAILPRLPRSGS
jgi:hypothetical protein